MYREKLNNTAFRHLKAVLLFTLLLIAHDVWAQSGKVEGVVTDETGEPLPGVSVLIKGTNRGTVTDVYGKFILPALNPTDYLLFSFTGMQTVEVLVGSQLKVDVQLKEDLLKLDELVVVGYGSQEKEEVTGSLAIVSDEDIKLRPNTQFGNLIQGKAAGVQVLSNSGKPSQGFNLRIRGTSSINGGSEPLYVVDGVPTTDTRSINPADIESITILKDAASAAIYGSQAANGVVLINTKTGDLGTTQMSFDSYFGFSEVWRTLDVLNARDYRILMTELGLNTDWSLYQEDTNWQDEIFQRGRSQNYQLAISGKSNKTSYYVSGGWTEQVGAVRSSRMDRFNFKVNLDHEVNQWLTAGTRLAYTAYADVDVNDNQAVNQGGVLLGALSTPPNIGIFNPDGTFTSNPFQNWENPIASTDGSIRDFRSRRFIGNTFLEFKVMKDLVFKTNVGIDHNDGIFDSFLDPFLTDFGRALNGRAINNTNRSSYYIFDNTVTYQKQFNKHKVDALAGVVFQRWDWESSGITTQNFSGNGITTPNAGSDIISATASKSEKANQSFISRLNYAYDDKYLFTANFRADGSSVFGPDNRWGYFPSFSAGWRISEEQFFQNVNLVNELKLRAGWGIVGNDQIGNNYAYLGLVGSGANYPIGGVVQPGTFPASISNSSIRWEETVQTSVGIDLGLFKSRLEVTLDAYVKRTNDLLLNAPVPRATGFDNAIQNIGSLENKGVEMAVNAVVVDKAVQWSVNANISVNRNTVLDLVGQELFVGAIAGRGEAAIVREGLPLGTIFGYQFGGVDPQTGDAFYINNEGESTFTPSADDRRVIGDANPDFIYGITNQLAYKNFTMTIFFQGAQGNEMLNATRIEMEGMIDPKNQSAVVRNRWMEPGDVTDIPRASWGNTDNSRISTRFVEDASYLRLKTLTIGYSLPKKIISKLGLSNLQTYVTGENLLTITNYTGFDPEVNAFGASNTVQGIDFGTFPQTRNFIIGLKANF